MVAGPADGHVGTQDRLDVVAGRHQPFAFRNDHFTPESSCGHCSEGPRRSNCRRESSRTRARKAVESSRIENVPTRNNECQSLPTVYVVISVRRVNCENPYVACASSASANPVMLHPTPSTEARLGSGPGTRMCGNRPACPRNGTRTAPAHFRGRHQRQLDVAAVVGNGIRVPHEIGTKSLASETG
jgi:hypothetical protein